MVAIEKNKILTQLASVAGTALVAALIALAQSLLTQSGFSCSPAIDPAVAGGIGGTLRVAFLVMRGNLIA